jgi:hypothetical protein
MYEVRPSRGYSSEMGQGEVRGPRKKLVRYTHEQGAYVEDI